jgi:hypothetical protein
MAAKAYRIFTRDLGHIQSSDILYADSDADAVSQARAMLAFYELEIWDGDRFVNGSDSMKPNSSNHRPAPELALCILTVICFRRGKFRS